MADSKDAGATRVFHRYRPSADRRFDRKRGLCGRTWCDEPAKWVWFDAAGHRRNLCGGHKPTPVQ
jgi:hypothetical protein